MVERNTAPHQTPYTVPVDHKSCRTGISAEERARTVRAIIDPTTRPDDLARPGHLFPLVAKDGGVLRRAGHTEATVDLARLAGLTPAGVLCEILDGTGVASRDRLHAISREHGLPIVSIESLIKYRRLREKLVNRVAEVRSADAIRPQPDHRLPRSARAGQRARRHRHGRPAVGRRTPGPAALVVFHRRSARFVAVRLRRSAQDGDGDDRRRGGRGARFICRRKDEASA